MTTNPDELPFQFPGLAEGYPYQVRAGDTWGIIAKATGMSTADLRRANPQVETLYSGLDLWIPGASSVTPPRNGVSPSERMRAQTPPSTSTPTGCPQGCCPAPPAGCVIKGNVKYEGTDKIYHLPRCEDYATTTINCAYGELWFCTEDEARANGWRKAKNCP